MSCKTEIRSKRELSLPTELALNAINEKPKKLMSEIRKFTRLSGESDKTK